MFHSRFAAALRRRALRAATLAAMLLLSIASPAWSQPRTASVAVTVVDQTGAVIGGATVTVTGTDEVTKAAGTVTVTSSNEGIANVPNLVPGRYAIEAQFTGFEPRVLANVALRPGNNKQVALLTVAGLKDSVTVAQDKQVAAVDPRGPSFGTQLTRDQIEALSDDPTILRQQLEEMAGPGAVFKVDSFEGRRAAGQGADPLDSHLARPVRGGESCGRRHVDRDHHAARPRADPLQRRRAVSRRLDERAQPLHADEGPGAAAQLLLRPERHADPGEELLQHLCLRHELLRDAEHQHRRRERHPLGAARPPHAPRQHQRERAARLRADARPHAAVRLQQQPVGRREPGRRRLRRGTAGVTRRRTTRHNIRAQHFGPLGRRAFTRSRVPGVRWSDSDSRSASSCRRSA